MVPSNSFHTYLVLWPIHKKKEKNSLKWKKQTNSGTSLMSKANRSKTLKQKQTWATWNPGILQKIAPRGALGLHTAHRTSSCCRRDRKCLRGDSVQGMCPAVWRAVQDVLTLWLHSEWLPKVCFWNRMFMGIVPSDCEEKCPVPFAGLIWWRLHCFEQTQ